MQPETSIIALQDEEFIVPPTSTSKPLQQTPPPHFHPLHKAVLYLCVFLTIIGQLPVFDRIKDDSLLASWEGFDREGACQMLFLHQGVEPKRTNVYLQQRLPSQPTQEQTEEAKMVLNEWEILDCDQFFCENNNSTHVNNDRKCQWTAFATRTLLQTEKVQECAWPSRVETFLGDPKWEAFRFAEYFKGNINFDKEVEQVSGLPLRERYAGSIMDEYADLSWERLGEYRPHQYSLLKEVVQRRANATEDLPDHNTAVIHLRLGDVMDAAVEPVPELLRTQHYFFREPSQPRNPQSAIHCHCEEPWLSPENPELVTPWNGYVRPLSYFADIDWTNITSIVIMGSVHMGSAESFSSTGEPVASCAYTYALKTYLERFKLNVTLRLGHSPDEDIVFASQAKTYIVSGGGFSRIVGTLGKMFGARVVQPHGQRERRSYRPNGSR